MDFSCPQCKTKHQAAYDAAGLSFQCSSCQKEFIVPAEFLSDPPVTVPSPAKNQSPATRTGTAKTVTSRTGSRTTRPQTASIKAAPGSGRAFPALPTPPTKTSSRPGEWRNYVPLLLQITAVVVLAIVGFCSWRYFLKDDTPAADQPSAGVAPIVAVDVAKVAPPHPAVAAAPTPPKPSAGIKPGSAKAAVVVAVPTQPAATKPIQAAVPPPKTLAEIMADCAAGTGILYADNTPIGETFLVFERSIAVTTLHNLHGAHAFLAEFNKGDTAKTHIKVAATVIAVDPDNDLALLHVSINNSYNLNPLELSDEAGASKGAAITVLGRTPTLDPAKLHVLVPGILSNTDQTINDHHFMQTDVAIGTGNSGAAVCNALGHVVGILHQIPGQESLGLIIPGLLIKSLYLGRNDHFKITGEFSTWEKNKVFLDLKGVKGSIALPHVIVAGMLYDAARSQLVVISKNLQRAVFINPKSGETIKVVALPGRPQGFALSEERHQLWISSVTPSMIFNVDLKTFAVSTPIKLAHDAVMLTLSKSAIWFIDGGGNVCAVRYNGRNEAESKIQCRALASSGGKNDLIAASKQEWLIQIDGDQLLGIMPKVAANAQSLAVEEKKQSDKYHHNNPGVGPDVLLPTSPAINALATEQIALNEQMNNCKHALEQPNAADVDPTSEFHSLLVDQAHERLYYSRCIVSLREPTKLYGQFPAPQHSLKGNSLLRAVFIDHVYSSQVLAVSADGTLAASGTQLYNVKNHNVITELPIPTLAVAFDPDQRILYYADVVNEQINAWELPVSAGAKVAR